MHKFTYRFMLNNNILLKHIMPLLLTHHYTRPFDNVLPVHCEIVIMIYGRGFNNQDTPPVSWKSGETPKDGAAETNRQNREGRQTFLLSNYIRYYGISLLTLL